MIAQNLFCVITSGRMWSQLWSLESEIPEASKFCYLIQIKDALICLWIVERLTLRKVES